MENSQHWSRAPVADSAFDTWPMGDDPVLAEWTDSVEVEEQWTPRGSWIRVDGVLWRELGSGALEGASEPSG